MDGGAQRSEILGTVDKFKIKSHDHRTGLLQACCPVVGAEVGHPAIDLHQLLI